MKKRIRKKLHRKEFTLYGFEMHLHCKDESDQALDELFGQLVALVQKYNWECYGVLQQFFVYERFPKQGIAEEKANFVNEVKQLPNVQEAHDHDVIDAWYGPAIDCKCHCDHD